MIPLNEIVEWTNSTNIPAKSTESDRHRRDMQDIQAYWIQKWNRNTDARWNIGPIDSIPYEDSPQASRVASMMELVQNITARVHNETRTNRKTYDRSALFPKKSVITFKGYNNRELTYLFLRESRAIDNEITKLPFLKLENTEDWRVVIWNWVMSPVEDIIYALQRWKGLYTAIDVPFNTVA